jgi:hypothetical protein
MFRLKIRTCFGCHDYRRLSVCLCVWILLPLFAAELVGAQDDPSPPYRPTVILNIKSLNENERSAVIFSLAKSINSTQWLTLVVNPGDSLTSVINQQYGFYQSDYRKTTDSLVKLISDANQLNDANSILAGQVLRIPTLPRRPVAASKVDLSQYLDLENNSLTLMTSKNAVVSSTKANTSIRKDLEQGSTWVISMTQEQNQEFLSMVKGEIEAAMQANKIYSGPTTQLEEIFGETDEFDRPNPDTSTQPISETNASTSVAERLQTIKSDKVGDYFILDYFPPPNSNKCTHGEMVSEVALETLTQLGLPQFKDHLHKVQIDFFEDKTSAAQIIRQYISTFPDAQVQSDLTDALNELLQKKKPKPDKKYVPLLYIQALYTKYVFSKAPTIVSSSFFFRKDGYKVLPAEYDRNNDTILAAAVMDDQGSKIEEVQTEPQQSFYYTRKDLGTILIGAEQSAGVFFGMYSEDGDGVSVLGKANGWGSSNTCISPDKIGTSFSTPNIAAELLIAQAYWISNGLKISAKDAKARLLLASDINPQYIDRFASAGVPRIERLLRLESSFVETSQGIIEDVGVQSGFVKIKNQNGAPFQLPVQKGPDGIRGLQVVEGKVFIFRDDLFKWKQVELEDDGGSITIVANGVTSSMTFRDFTKQFKEIVLL